MAERKASERLAAELSLPAQSVENTMALLEGRATPSFLARYRKERTGGLSEEQIRAIARRLRQLQSLEQRKATILKQIEAQDKLTEQLRARIQSCLVRWELEDLYLPFRPKRRSRGTLAKERGLEPLARAILEQQPQAASPEEMAAPHVNPDRGVPDARAALAGACHILAEWVAEKPETRGRLRQLFSDTGVIRSRVVKGREGEHSKYEMYYDFTEPVRSIPSHRVLAIRRGEKEGWLSVRVEVDRERALETLRQATITAPQAPSAALLETAIADAYDRLIAPALEADVRSELKRRADTEAIAVFTRNLRNLLLQPPAGPVRTLGVVPGYRTGCKLAVVDEIGKPLETHTVFPHPPQSQLEAARSAARGLIERHNVEAIAIANGTASRETDQFFRTLIKEMPDRRIVRMIVNEAGANVYASSRTAREELPNVAPALRSAISIARRLQDPLYELVQIDPKAIGVGQYQHDVNQQALREALEAGVESAVNWVGVDVNRASASLLSYVAGLDRAVAREIVQYRGEHGPFRSRAGLRAVARLDERRFAQAAGFLRVRDGEQPLDASAVHPERYELVARIAAEAGTDVPGLLGNERLIRRIDFSRYAGDDVGEPTLADIRRELVHPGRDRRRAFRSVEFRDDVTAIENLEPGMILEGTVTNVTNFGAFVDIGVQEDGLVHVSELSRRYVKDPIEAVQVGAIVRVKVLSVDTERRRIGLSIKAALPPRHKRKPRAKAAGKKGRRPPSQAKQPKRSPHEKATPEDIARLIAHFQARYG